LHGVKIRLQKGVAGKRLAYIAQKITAIMAGGGYFRLFLYDFHAMYAAHTTPMADMSAIRSEKASYNDNRASPPFVFSFGGFWLTAYRYGNALMIF